jgi:apolipoprotein N-acyltransferase
VSPRLKGFSSVFVFPLAATTIEFVNIYTNPVGMWGATGFTQYGDLALMQLSSLTGMIGITFLMGWFASVTNWAWENRGRGREVLRGVGAFGMVLATVYIFGFLRLNLAPMSDTEETVRVAGITSLSQSIVKKQVSEAPDLATEGSVLQAYWQTYLDETVREAQAGAKVIIWDEAVGISGSKFGVDEGILIDHAQEIARQNEIYLLLTLGVFYLDPEQPGENKLLMIDPTGTIMFEHVKYGGNMVEGTLLGDGRLHTLDTSFGVLSGVVCWDMDYPAIIQQAGRNGTGLMLVPSRDWFEIDPLHGQMAVFRAIENGMSMVRQTDQGLSIAVDAYGHVLAQTDFFGATDRTMVAQVPVKDVTTVYALGGRWLEWLAPIGFLFIVSRALIGRRREQSAPLDE